MEHYVPLHPQLAGVMEILCDGREGNECTYAGTLSQVVAEAEDSVGEMQHLFRPSDLQKFAEQHGDIGMVG
jgi:hypothetical protein